MSSLTNWNKNGELIGFIGDLLHEFEANLNFTSKIQMLENSGSWNGTYWTGAMGLLVDREVDLVVSGMALQPIRMSRIDFTVPLDYETTALFIRDPKIIYNVTWSGYFKV